LTCRDVDQFLMRYANGELSPREQFTFDCHLALCGDCMHYVDSYIKTTPLARDACRRDDAPAHDAPPGLLAAVFDATRL
jgi:hypothetical protein